VAIVDAYNDPDAESDLATYRSRYGISACTTGDGCFRKVNQTGGSSYPTAEAGWAVEISLDMDMVSAACPNCHILLVEASSNSNGDLYTAEDEAVALGATEVSNSWGSKEESSETSDDSYFHHTGALITAAAGDFGYEVEYPAASQYVIAVGGTTLTQAANSRGWSETAWSGTGSGCSAYEPKPAWQTDSPLCTARTNNDVAAVASPETPVSVADSYKLPSEFSKPEPGWTLVGGTSVSSPLTAGTMALANTYTKSFPGADALYKEATQNGTGVLDDVVSGSNGSCGNYLCEAGPGYDGPTGLGSPYGAPVVLPNPPTVVTKAASAVTLASASLNATVNPNGGEVSECKFEYGTTNSYESRASCTPPPGSGSSPVAVSASVGSLAANTTYHFRVVATNAGGTSKGSDQTLTTLPNPPTVVTKAASPIAQSSATLNASVNPNGGEVSACKLEYGTTNSYESSAPCASLPGSGTSAAAVSASVTGLAVSTTYHFRISATNPGGTSKGSDETFTTMAAATTPPTVVTGTASSLTQAAATLNASVNPNGGEVSECKFEYGTTTSYGSSAPCSVLPGASSSTMVVAASVGGLSAATTYYFRIVAANPGGTSYGVDQALTTLLPTTLPQQGPGRQETLPGLGMPPPQEHKTPPVPDAKLASTSLTVSPSGIVNVKVTCPAGESSCTGTVMLQTLNAVIAGATVHQSKKRKAAILTLASGSFRVAGGQVKTLTLRLSAEARKLLATTHVLRARATIVAHAPTGAKHTTQTIVTLRALKATRHRGKS
jgi:subtilase family serine protease